MHPKTFFSTIGCSPPRSELSAGTEGTREAETVLDVLEHTSEPLLPTALVPNASFNLLTKQVLG